MSALVVTLSPANDMMERGGRVEIFPGGATTTMYPANTAFWIGYGFAAESGADAEFEESTRFELDVDGIAASMLTDIRRDERPPRKTNIAAFPSGLPAGWHDFTGRWYDQGRLVLSSRAAIQFVEA